MTHAMNRPELLSPAGDLEKLRFAYIYGADAAYMGGDFSLRGNAKCSLDDLAQARALADTMGKKLYITLNAFADNRDVEQLPAYIGELAKIAPHGLIVSDPGVFSLCREYAPDVPLHISTQSNNTNWRTAQFWAQAGARRIVLARELSLAEAAEISRLGGLETEIFVHGAICISYSGRCLISTFLNGQNRSANRGDCSHPCRWKYALLEEKRPGEYFPIEEDARGSYIMNSKDLCLLDCVPQLMESGISSWKIEGRGKSALYTANITRIYRAAIDAYMADPTHYMPQSHWKKELASISHRDYTTGFALGKPQADAFRYTDNSYLREHNFAAILTGSADGWLMLEQRNYFAAGSQLEVILPDGTNVQLPVQQIVDENGMQLDAARHPLQKVRIPNVLPEQKWQYPLICRNKV